MGLNWIDFGVIALFSLYLIIRETIPFHKKFSADFKYLVFVLSFFRFSLYAIPLYVADIVFAGFIVSFFSGQPFVDTPSLNNNLLRLALALGVFALANRIYPKVFAGYLSNLFEETPKISKESFFYFLLNKTIYRPFLSMVFYICILLTVVIPLLLYALFIQCPPSFLCRPF